jgi:ParB/RepB/Spo0J family partition protein
MAQIQHLATDSLADHPDNPRLQLREDVIERLVSEMTASGFGPEHAILVRPYGDGYQIISGHHRAEAAKRVGLAEVPAWVKDMDDDEAFMQLVLANSQGELSPLEIGMHALTWPGEQKEYAERTGFGKSYISQLRSGAEVARVYSSKLADLADKAKHLYEISRARRVVWPLLVESLIKRGWSVADTKATADKIRAFAIPGEHAAWLPLTDVTARFLSSGKPSPAAIDQLVSTVDGIIAAIERDGTEEDAEAFRAWLVENRGKDSWDRRKISDYHVSLIREWAERAAAAAAAAAEEEDEPGLPDGVDIRLGDFRDALKDLEPGSVDAIITDPPYPAEFVPLFADIAALAARVLKPGGLCAVMVGQSYLPDVYRLMTRDDLAYHWTLAYLTPGGQATQLWQRKVNTFWKPILVYSKGEYTGPWLGDVASSDVNDNDKNHHHWGQSESGMADLIERLSRPGDLICDPFLGGGTTAVVAHDLGRRFVGCDTEEDCLTATTARFVERQER